MNHWNDDFIVLWNIKLQKKDTPTKLSEKEIHPPPPNKKRTLKL